MLPPLQSKTIDIASRPTSIEIVSGAEPNTPALVNPARPPRLSTPALLRELADELFSLDRGLPWTFGQLLRRPGAAIRRFVEWRDPRVTRPLRYLLIALATTALGFHLAGISGDWLRGFEAGFAGALNSGQSAGALVALMQRFDLLLVVAWIPGVAAAVQSVYRSHALNFAEAGTIGIYTLAQVALLQIPVVSVIPMGTMAEFGVFALWPFAYLSWVCHGYFADDEKRIVKALRVGLLAGFSTLATVMAMMLLAAVINMTLTG